MPGVGKSTLGRALAKALGLEFIDADDELVRRNGVEIATIFEIEGETGFRQREMQVIADLVVRQGVVLATGGGAILCEDSRRALRANGTVVYLRASLEVLHERTARDSGKRKKRPLLAVGDVFARLAQLLSVREPLYEQTAHLVVDASSTQRAKFVQQLVHQLDAYWQKVDAPTDLQTVLHTDSQTQPQAKSTREIDLHNAPQRAAPAPTKLLTPSSASS